MDFIAIDVALLPPADIRQKAIDLSAALPIDAAHNLRLDDTHLPHVTLTQQFVRQAELDEVLTRVEAIVREQPPLTLNVTGSGHSGKTIWMSIEPTPPIVDLHHRLSHALRGLERPEGGPHAFVGGDARVGDVAWVSAFRLKSSFGSYTPHITLGHGDQPPAILPFTFDASTLAVCHLGRFCTCRHVFRQWTLK